MMRITIDYDGSTAKCTLSELVPLASQPDLSPSSVYNFKDAGTYVQNMAIDAMRCVIRDFEREKENRKI